MQKSPGEELESEQLSSVPFSVLILRELALKNHANKIKENDEGAALVVLPDLILFSG